MNIRINSEKIIITILVQMLVFVGLLVLFREIDVLLILFSSLIISFYILILFFSKDLLNPMMLLILVTGLGTLDVIVVALGLRVPRFQVQNLYIVQALLVINIWHLMFLSGYFVSQKTKIMSSKIKDSIIKSTKSIYNDKIVFRIVLILMIFGALLVIRTSLNYGGLISAMQNRGSAYDNLGFLPLLIGLGGIIPVLLYHKNKKKTAIFSLLLIFGIQSLLGGRTTAIFTSFLPMLFYYNYNVKLISKKKMLILAIPVAVFVVFWGQLRMLGSVNSDIGVIEFLITLTRDKNYGQNLPYLIYSIDSGWIDYQYFNFALNIIFAFIPRSIWPNKPSIDEAGLIGRMLYGERSTGQPVGPYGFAFICFSWIGVVVFAFFAGYITSRVNKYVKNKQDYKIWLWYSYVAVSFYGIWSTSAQLDIIWFSFWFISFMFLSRILSSKRRI